MANDSSLRGAKQLAFDLDSQKGVAHVLASVRASDLQSGQKNELRDLIFLYSHGGKDPSVRITLEQKLAAFAVEALPVAPVLADAKSYSFGTSRPSPSFVPVSITNKPPAPAPEEQTPAAPKAPPAQPVDKPESEPKPEPTSAAIDAPKESNPLPPSPEPKPAPVLVSSPTVDKPIVTTESAEAPAPSYDPDKNLQRIREIKSLVNERVGNPVNLVDIDNQVGREYMGALLDAMKKINSGSSAADAMRRLEASYQMVDKTLSSKPQTSKDTVSTAAPDSPHASTPATSEVTQQVSERKTASAPTPISDASTPMPEVNNKPAPQSVPSESPVQDEPPVAPPIPQAPAVVKLPVKQPPAVMPESQPKVPVPTNLPTTTQPSQVSEDKPLKPPTSAPKPKPEAKTESANEPTLAEQLTTRKTPPQVVPAGEPAPIVDRNSQTEIKPEWGEHTDTIKKEDEVSEGDISRAHSLAESEVKPRQLEDLPSAASLETSSVNGDPLFTKEVDSGLEQLLSEWSLFKKSGLFGTGPKGHEHPLYKKISGLQIPLLLAGRFEGATQEIKQSITDYMNGWRYEQGIIYQQGENFEHYLRRVIRHIIDLQNR